LTNTHVLTLVPPGKRGAADIARHLVKVLRDPLR